MITDYVITYSCKYCKQPTRQLVKELSVYSFKVSTKSDYITWCEICSTSRFIGKDKYKELEGTKEIITKTGGILWKALCNYQGSNSK